MDQEGIKTMDQREIKIIKMEDHHQIVASSKTGTTTSDRKIKEDHLIKNVRTTAPRRSKTLPQFRKANPQLQTLELALKQLLKLVLVHVLLKYLRFALMRAQLQNLLDVTVKSSKVTVLI